MNYRWIFTRLLIVLSIPALAQTGGSEKLSSGIDLAILNAENALYEAKIDEALNYVTLARFTSHVDFKPQHEIKLRLQQIRLQGFANILFRLRSNAKTRLEALLRLQPEAFKLSDQSVKAAYQLTLSAAYRSIGRADSAMYYENQAFQLYEGMGNQEQLARIRANRISREHNTLLAKNNKAAILEMIPRYKEEISYSEKHSQYALAYNTRHLAQIHRRQTFNYTEALRLFQQSLALRQEIGFKPFIPASLSSVGDVYMAMGSWQHAIDTYTQSVELARAIGFIRHKFYPMMQIGSIYEQMDDNQKALESYRQALASALEDKYAEGAKEAREKIEKLNK